jgi:hypothetical protein
MNSLFGPFTLIAFGEHAPRPPVTTFDTLDAAKAALAALVVPEDARVLVMGNRRTSFGSVRLPVA